MYDFLKRNYFIISVLILFVIVNAVLEIWDPVKKYTLFYKNDLMRTEFHHPEEPWSKVFFGNSAVVASYDADKSDTGFVNAGIAYGKMTDLKRMLSGEHIRVTNELAVGLNFFTFMDELPTDKTYIWHKEIYEPYVYFYRDFIMKAVKTHGETLLQGEEIIVNEKQLYQKELYYGQFKPKELKQKQQEYIEKYGDLTLVDFEDNLKALLDVITYAEKNDIRLKFMWMPFNPAFQTPPYVEELKESVNKTLRDAGIDVVDWTDKYEIENFHDLGHLNVEKGRPLFTEEVAKWLSE